MINQKQNIVNEMYKLLKCNSTYMEKNIKIDPCKLTIKRDKPLLLTNKNRIINFDDVKSSKGLYTILVDKHEKNPS